MSIERHTLRSSTHRALIEHRCDNCDHLICPGDLYTVTVEVRGTGKAKWLYVRKEHEHPFCPYPDGDGDEAHFAHDLAVPHHPQFKIAA